MTTTTTTKKGGARPGAGRPQKTYTISREAARKLKAIATHHNSDAAQTIEGLINNYYSSTLSPSVNSNVEQLMAALTPEPQTVEKVRKQLRMTKADLESLIIQNWGNLIERGVHIHTATASEIAKAIKLPSRTNPTEHSYYSKLSKNLFST
jgi:hypothetical protein